MNEPYFFCDAVVAIAITLLALDIKIGHIEGHLQFSDIAREWQPFIAFFLSFINIANFWKTYHNFFSQIKKMDEKLVWYNIFWLFLLCYYFFLLRWLVHTFLTLLQFLLIV